MRKHPTKQLAGIGVALATAATFVVVAAPPALAAAPTITSFTPTSGSVGTSVTITGTNFLNPTVNIVKFWQGVEATFTVNSDTQITATVPAGANTGPIKVRNADGVAQSSADFTVTGGGGQLPTISSFSPGSGPVGTSVTIQGNHFTGATSVRFNGVAASFTVNNDNRITATVPNNATTGRITVTTPAGTATSATNFRVTQGPEITSFSPTSGPPGTKVEIFGRRFGGATSVRFNGVSASFTVNATGTKITATVPSGATTGKITVTTPLGTVESSGTFTVTSGSHGRSVSFHLHGHLVATGRVVALDGYDACERNVPVVIKRLVNGRWRWVETTSTRDDGTYRARIRDRRGAFRARAKRIVLVNDAICRGDRSGIRFHRH